MMEAIEGFLAMGGYAAYVWPSILVTLAVLLGLAWQARVNHASARDQVRARLRQIDARSDTQLESGRDIDHDSA